MNGEDERYNRSILLRLSFILHWILYYSHQRFLITMLLQVLAAPVKGEVLRGLTRFKCYVLRKGD
jgi:hypothetical protein